MFGLTKAAPLPGSGRRALPPEQRETEKDREIRFLGDLQRLRPEPGDVFVLSVDQRLSAEEQGHLRAQWQKIMGEAKVLVLEKGMRLACVAALADQAMVVRVGAHHVGITK